MLLVAGDSFAQFPSDHPDGAYRDTKLIGIGDHWTQIVSNHNAKAIGAGGFDLGYTSLTAMEELYRNNYSHCIFFITDFVRMSTQKVNENIQILDKVFTSQDSPQEFYGDMFNQDIERSGIRLTPELNKAYHEQADFGGHESKHVSIPPIGDGGTNEYHGDVENLAVFHWSGMTPIKDDPELHNYLKLQPAYEYMHTRLGYISLLKNYCNNNDIKIIFVCPFMDSKHTRDLNDFLQIDIFELWTIFNKEKQFNSKEFRECVSHFNEEQHQMLAQVFHNRYPGWIN